MKKVMTGIFALGLLGASSAAFAEDGDQYVENLYVGYNASVSQQAALRDAQASVFEPRAVRPFTAAEDA